MPSYRPQTMIKPGSDASSAARFWSRRSPQGSISTTGPGLCGRIESTASKTGSGLRTMPGPPPKGMSSTCRWRSCVWSRRSCVWSSTSPRSMPRPTTPCSNTGPNMAGKIVTTSNLNCLCVLDLDQPVGDDDAPGFEVHLEHRVAGGRDQVLDRALAADPHVVGRPFEDLLDRAQWLARAGQHRETDELVVVIAPLAERPARRFGNFEVAAAEQVRHRAVVDAGELYHEARLARPAPLDLVLRPVEDQCRAGVEPILKICQGNHLDSTDQAVGPRHLSDADHDGVPPPCSRRSRGEEFASEGLARSTNTRLRSRSDATRTSVLMASMLRPALPMKRPTSPSASFTLMATVPPPRSNDSTCTSSGFSASERATYSTSAL